MNKYFYKEIPHYRIDSFCSVRTSLDNLTNILNVAEIINTAPHCSTEEDNDFDIAIFTGNNRRIFVKKDNSFFSMAIPFQIIVEEVGISFNSDQTEEKVSGQFISIMRNCIKTVQNQSISHEDVILSLVENFDINITDAMKYYDAFVHLISDDHGYFRFDDDPENQNGDIHPRYHFDIFFKNSTSLKIGYDRIAKLECFFSLIDNSLPKKYLIAR